MSLTKNLTEQIEAEILYSTTIDGRPLCVKQFENYRWLQSGGEAIQSLVNVNAPDKLLSPVGAGMVAALALAEQPERVLNLGFGLGSFERFFRACCPSMETVSIESNKTVIDLARRYFFVSDDTPVINVSAEQYLENAQTGFDVILCDIFAGESHPPCLKHRAFYQHLHRCLRDTGVLAVNLLTQEQTEVVEILAAMRHCFPWTALYEVPEHGNVIVFACKRDMEDLGELKKRASARSMQYGFDPGDVIRNLHILPLKERRDDRPD